MSPSPEPTIPDAAKEPGAPGPRRIVVVQIVLVGVFLLMVVLAKPLRAHATAAGVLLRLSDSGDTMGLRDFGASPVTRTSVTLDLPGGAVPAYRYESAAGPAPFGIVLVHGVHWKSIDEPRLKRFAESLAATGLSVLTPRVPSLADYRIDQAAVVEIGAAAHALREQLGGEHKVGVLGVSFAGSLALLAAADPSIGADIGYVVTVGSYDDLGRVCRFYGTGTIERPDGTVVELRPHDYGPVVWIYSHLSDFFPEDGRGGVQEALREWLHEEKDSARARTAKLPEDAKAKLTMLFDGDVHGAFPGLEASIERHASELDALSPHGHLSSLKAAVFLLHGSDDHLIPPSETLWLAHDLPPGSLAYALISRAVTHVEIGERTPLLERIEAVHFMAGILAEARHPG